MSNEYYAVILEFNFLSVKLGFARELREHVRIDSKHLLWSKFITKTPLNCHPSYLELSSHCLDKSLRDELCSKLETNPLYLRMLTSYVRDRDNLEWYDWSTDGYLALSRLVRHLLSTSLLVSPSKCKLFVVDSGMSATSKDQLCAALFKYQTCVSIAFLSLSLSVVMSSGLRNALVVDFGWDCCRISAIIDLQIIKCEHIVAFSHETIHFKFLLAHEIENFNEVEERIRADARDDTCSLNALSLQELPSRLAEIIKKTSIDNRPLLAQNVIFTGRLLNYGPVAQLILRETHHKLKSMTIQAVANLGAWSGASLYCSTILLKENYNNWRHIQISRGQLDANSKKELEQYYG